MPVNRQKEGCKVYLMFYMNGLICLALLPYLWSELVQSSIGQSPTATLVNQPIKLIHQFLGTFLVGGFFIGAAGEGYRSPTLLAIGLVTVGSLILGLTSYMVITLAWVLKRSNDLSQCTDKGNWHMENIWCYPGYVLMLNFSILCLYCIFFYSVCIHWIKANDRYNKPANKIHDHVLLVSEAPKLHEKTGLY